MKTCLGKHLRGAVEPGQRMKRVAANGNDTGGRETLWGEFALKKRDSVFSLRQRDHHGKIPPEGFKSV